jgi:putative phosphoesterase
VKLAILSDIHANLHALQAVWADLETFKPDAVYCLGDLVGYGAYPNETIEFIRERQVHTIMGNYDEGVGFDLEDCGCVYKDPIQAQLGKHSQTWTQKSTSPDNKNYLQTLPLQLRIERNNTRLLLVHGSPRKINEYLFEDRPEATFERIARTAGAEILLFGHTHLPYKKQLAETLFINCGSVGKPKDGNPEAGYVMLSIGRTTEVDFKRTPYNIESAVKSIYATDLPNEYAEELKRGGATKAIGGTRMVRS